MVDARVQMNQMRPIGIKYKAQCGEAATTHPLAVDGNLRLRVNVKACHFGNVANTFHVRSIAPSPKDARDLRRRVDIVRGDQRTSCVACERHHLSRDVL